MNRRAIVMMFLRLSVRLSVCPSGAAVHCDHTVHFSADLSLWLDSPMFWAPWHQNSKHVHLFPAVFLQFHLEERFGMDVGLRGEIKARTQHCGLDTRSCNGTAS